MYPGSATSPCIALLLFISHSTTNQRRFAGSNKAIKIAPVLTLGGLELTRFSIHCTAIHASKRSRKRLCRRANSLHLRDEDRQLLFRTEAAQRLQLVTRMPEVEKTKLRFEIGHVLFIDIVGYSKLLINEQSEQIQTLRKIVRGTEQVRLAEAEGKLVRLPTGDGGALVFRNSPEAPVLCALEISKELKSHPELQVRMGIHSGPVNEVTDLDEQANIAGAGINIAQRVMDCGDAGHILLSKHVADDLEQYPQWRS